MASPPPLLVPLSSVQTDPHEIDLEALVRDQLPRVRGLLLKLVGPRTDLDDLVQTVFLELLRALPRFRGDAALSTFVGGIVVRVARRARTPDAYARRRSHEAPAPKTAANEPERRAADRERMRRVRAALERIKPNKRIAFILWALEGMEPSQIAELMDASLSATRSRIYHAQRELRAMAEHDPYLREALEEQG